MLWSILKVAVFIALVGAATFGASYLLELDGGVRIVMAGVEVNLTPIKAMIALGVLVGAIWLLMKLAGMLVALLRFINGDETALSRYFDRNRQEKGYRALGEGMLALASGEGETAMAQAAKAQKYLRKPALTDLVTAQGAEIAGDKAKAEAAFRRLLSNDKTRFVGVRGLLRQKLDAGETDAALKLAKSAFALKPRQVEIQDTLLQLQADKGAWKDARATLGAKLKFGSLPRDVHKRRDAVLALSEARDMRAEDKMRRPARRRSRPTACRPISCRRRCSPRRAMSRPVANAPRRASSRRRGRPTRIPISPPPLPRSSPTRRRRRGSSALPSC